LTNLTQIPAWGPDTGTRRVDDVLTLGDLSAVLAHEMRNPLSSIKGAAQILQEECGSQKPHTEFLAIILDEVETLTAMTTEFLDHARPHYPELACTRRNDSVGSAVRAVQIIAEDADIHMDVELDESLPDVLMDQYQMERAMRNILVNAVESTARGDVVLVRTFPVPDGVAMAVTDWGMGVPTELISRVFVPFFTTKVTGTGLGLPVARKIAQYHGGDVSAMRNDGPGMTFLIHLPVSGDGAE
jgi:signal transduction histidine kinase